MVFRKQEPSSIIRTCGAHAGYFLNGILILSMVFLASHWRHGLCRFAAVTDHVLKASANQDDMISTRLTRISMNAIAIQTHAHNSRVSLRLILLEI